MQFAGNLEARLEGFEPPTRGLGMRRDRYYGILACRQLLPMYVVFDVSAPPIILASSAQFWSGCSTVAVIYASSEHRKGQARIKDAGESSVKRGGGADRSR
jgi:hypothetical protein